MKGETHFIELYKVGERYKLNQTSLNKIEFLNDTIDCTRRYPELKTIAVWVIKPKHSALLASHDNEVGATVIEKVNI